MSMHLCVLFRRILSQALLDGFVQHPPKLVLQRLLLVIHEIRPPIHLRDELCISTPRMYPGVSANGSDRQRQAQMRAPCAILSLVPMASLNAVGHDICEEKQDWYLGSLCNAPRRFNVLSCSKLPHPPCPSLLLFRTLNVA